jgi:CTP synthase
MESMPYIESVRQLKLELGSSNALVIHLTLVPYLSASGELKTKPTQHSVKVLLENGIQPDILVLRTEKELSSELKKKVALFCNVDFNSVIQSIDVNTIYEVPVLMQKEGMDITVLKKLGMKTTGKINMKPWETFLYKIKNPKKQITIALVGKYVELKDAYKSINESFIHAGALNECKVIVKSIHSEKITKDNLKQTFKGCAGILVAPGFGGRGIDGKILAVKYARENNIPFLGICLGMQCAVIEFARNVLKLKDAHSTEMDEKTNHPVIDLMENQKRKRLKGGTMRLGNYPCKLLKDSMAFRAYKSTLIQQRHRHRYEFNNKYLEAFEKAGMKATGINPDSQLIEIIEIPSHRWFIGVQFHPEYNSTVMIPHPLFVSFIRAALHV